MQVVADPVQVLQFDEQAMHCLEAERNLSEVQEVQVVEVPEQVTQFEEQVKHWPLLRNLLL